MVDYEGLRYEIMPKAASDYMSYLSFAYWKHQHYYHETSGSGFLDRLLMKDDLTLRNAGDFWGKDEEVSSGWFLCCSYYLLKLGGIDVSSDSSWNVKS